MNTQRKTPVYIEKSAVYRGLHHFSYYGSKTDCGHSLELPHQGGSNNQPQSMLGVKSSIIIQ